MPSRERKGEFMQKMITLMDENSKILILHADHVGSNQFHKIRKSLRGLATVLMGKNTLMRKVVNEYVESHPGSPYSGVLDLLRGNVCFIFTNGDLGQVREVINDNRVPAAAKAGVLAECDVIVPPGPTGCDPGQTSWFQALNVPTKISRGQIEIVSTLKLVEKGTKVGSSEAALLQKLNIRPFTYGLVLKTVYDNGAIFDAKVLDISEDDIANKFAGALRRFTAVSMAAGFPTLSAVPHYLGNAVRRMIAVCAETEIKIGEVGAAFDALFNMDPEELAKLQAAAAAAGGGGEETVEEEKEEEEEEEVDVGGGNLFGDEEGY